METIAGATDIYFHYCHNRPYSLFHEESFRNRLASNEVPQHLLFAFLASAVRYSEGPYHEDKVSAISTYSVQAWKAMALPWNGIETDVGIIIVRTILLRAIIDYTGQSYGWSSLYVSGEAEPLKMARRKAPGLNSDLLSVSRKIFG